MLWHLQRVRKLVRARAGLGAHALVSVTEIPCDDPACPGLATQITILGFDLMRRVLVIHRRVAEVTADDIDIPALSGTNPVVCADEPEHHSGTGRDNPGK